MTAVDFLYAYENRPSELYYPIEGLGGCEFSPEGTLIFTDEKRGKVYGRDGNTRTWYEFDSPTSRPYQPVDAAVDGFKVLVLDRGSGQVNRHDLSGAFLDVLVDIRRVDPVIQTSPSAFGVDRDGRMALADQAQQQVLLLDTFQNLTMRVGDPGSLRDQFTDPSGLTFLPDGAVGIQTIDGEARFVMTDTHLRETLDPPELAKSIVSAWLDSEFQGGGSTAKVERIKAYEREFMGTGG